MRPGSLIVMAVTLTALFVIPLVSLATSANPFGFATETHPMTYGYCKKDDDPDVNSRDFYVCNDAPRPYPGFYEYNLHFVEGAGVCWLSAAMTGKDLRSEALEIMRHLTKKYGEPTTGTSMWDKKDGFRAVGNVTNVIVTSNIHRQESGDDWIQVFFLG